jgi:hypothetical protein
MIFPIGVDIAGGRDNSHRRKSRLYRGKPAKTARAGKNRLTFEPVCVGDQACYISSFGPTDKGNTKIFFELSALKKGESQARTLVDLMVI